MWTNKNELEKFEVLDGDLLVCEGGEVGRASILKNVPNKCIIQNALHRIRSKKKNSLKFLKYLLETMDWFGWFEVLCNRATIAHLTGDKLGDLEIYIPEAKEQLEIVSFLDKKTTRIDLLAIKNERGGNQHLDEPAGKIKTQIEKLREYRQTLISAAMTGKIDLREEVA